MIGSYLKETDSKPRHCHACGTDSATKVCVDPLLPSTPPELTRISGTRCDACGDVRLYQTLIDGSTDPDIRDEIDLIARMLTEFFKEELLNGRH